MHAGYTNSVLRIPQDFIKKKKIDYVEFKLYLKSR